MQSYKLDATVNKVSKTNMDEYKKLDLINERDGEKVSTPSINTIEIINAIDMLKVKQEFIKSVDLSLKSEMNLIMLILKPRFENSESSPVTEMIEEASPTSSAVYTLAVISQKIKPEALLITELATRYAAFVKSESSKEIVLFLMFYTSSAISILLRSNVL